MIAFARNVAWVVLGCWAGLSGVNAAQAGVTFKVTLKEGLSDKPISGRVFVFLSRNNSRPPMFGPNWFGPEPFYGKNVTEMQPGTSVLLSDDADGYPGKLSELAPGAYSVQAMLDHDFYAQDHARGTGNLFSEAHDITVGNEDTEITLELNSTVPEFNFQESDTVKEVVVQSKLLSDFHKRDVVERAAVILPPSYANEPERRYPVYYEVPGFGGSHTDAQFARRRRNTSEEEVQFIHVMLSGQCKWGHHVYADSATNGPRGAALVQEIIPEVDRLFRTIAEPTARFVGGHSSGGWSSLWLQVTYPETFGGVWSSSPDPVDFRDFQRINIYRSPPDNAYLDEAGNRRPIARRGEQPVLWYQDFCKMDDCLAKGGQLRSFEAVFSPLDAQGLPQLLWDRKTGLIDPEVAKAWEKYDIRLVLERNWDTLGPKLKGKLHITMGTLDTFYLEGATMLLAKTLEQLGSDAQVTFVEGADHGTVLGPEYGARVRKEMRDAFLEHHADAVPAAAGAN